MSEDLDVTGAGASPEGTADGHRTRLGRLDDATRGFVVWLLVIASGGLLLRLLVITLRPACTPDSFGDTGCFSGKNDALYYNMQANLIADGKWYRVLTPAAAFEQFGQTRPSALHPPLYSTVLGIASWSGIDTPFGQRVVSAVVGSTAIIVLGLVAKRLAGPRAGVIAAVLVAVYPAIWINDTLLLSEAAYAPVAGLAVLAAYRFWERRTTAAAVWLGVAIGVATLARAETLLLVPFTVLPLALGASELAWKPRLARLAAASGACVLVLLPWTLFTYHRFEEPVIMTTSAGQGLGPANCDTTYYGDLIGSAASDCTALDLPPELDESQQDAILRARSREYILDHESRLPTVMAARVGRTFHFYAPLQQVELSWRFDNRGRWASGAALVAYYVLLPFGVFGAVVLHRRKLPLSPLLGLVAASLLLSATVYGLVRYRLPADLALAVVAAVGMDAILRRLPREQEPGRDPDAESAS